MRILFITERMPFPLHNGNAILTWHTLEHLAKRHEVDVIAYPALAEGDDGISQLLRNRALVSPPRLRARRLQQVASLATTRSAIEAVSYDRQYSRVLSRMLREESYDVVVIDHLRMGWVARIVRDVGGSARIVFRSHNCEADVRRLYRAQASGLGAIALGWEWRKTRLYEERVVRSADAVIAVTEEDAELHRRQGATRVFAVPPGFEFGAMEGASEESSRMPGTVVLMGSFGYLAKEMNALFLLKKVFPRVRQKIPEARLLLVGAGASRRLTRVAERAEGVAITGRVPDAHAIARRCEVFVMPTIVGGGFELKGLEAIGLRVPIAATPLARRGLDLEPGRSISIGADEQELAARLVYLLTDAEARRRQADSAYAEAAQKYRWPAVNARLEAAISNACEGPPNRAQALVS